MCCDIVQIYEAFFNYKRPEEEKQAEPAQEQQVEEDSEEPENE